jgi:transposase
MDMRKTKLMVTHPEVTREKLDDFVSGRGPVRMGLRVAILQGVIDKAPIDQMSRRHNLSRQGIYDLVKRVNEKGIKGVEEEKRSGRPSSLTPEIANNLKEILLKPPTSQGYSQSRWDGPLVRTYLKEKHDINIGRSQVNNWIHIIDFSLQRGRKKYIKADPEKQEAFVEALKKTPKSAT